MDSPNCNYCGELNYLTHIVDTYNRLSVVFQLTNSLICKLIPTIDNIPVWGILLVSQLVVFLRHLGNWIFGQAKSKLFIIIYNKNKSNGTHCIVTLFKAKVITRVNMEYQFSSV